MPQKPRPSALEARPSAIEQALDMRFCFDPQHAKRRLTDIRQRLGWHKSTTHRLLSLLKKQRLITAAAPR
jgi:DNA-binding IclR family transcriptional regulator